MNRTIPWAATLFVLGEAACAASLPDPELSAGNSDSASTPAVAQGSTAKSAANNECITGVRRVVEEENQSAAAATVALSILERVKAGADIRSEHLSKLKSTFQELGTNEQACALVTQYQACALKLGVSEAVQMRGQEVVEKTCAPQPAPTAWTPRHSSTAAYASNGSSDRKIVPVPGNCQYLSHSTAITTRNEAHKTSSYVSVEPRQVVLVARARKRNIFSDPRPWLGIQLTVNMRCQDST